MTRARTIAACDKHAAEELLSKAWRSLDSLSIAEPDDLKPITKGLIECREKLDQAIARAA